MDYTGNDDRIWEFLMPQILPFAFYILHLLAKHFEIVKILDNYVQRIDIYYFTGAIPFLAGVKLAYFFLRWYETSHDVTFLIVPESIIEDSNDNELDDGNEEVWHIINLENPEFHHIIINPIKAN
ncbi:hypothetical protein HNY73_015369 [Argiope bruennichi]|uniref:Uncharacterized protein n=1 Tax=Argiope bruennichi TaxID=94029 RepID=A0A8T0ETA1_ARGBR|nr:hypothetical protein HNY73_015369 [Argiope bruennichi]